MAQVACKGCSQQVSNWAFRCPHCSVSNPSMTKKRLIIAWLVLAVICWFGVKSCLSTANAPDNQSTVASTASVAAPSYTIISSENRAPLKRAYEISIPERYSEAQLAAIAHNIYTSRLPKADRTFIGYRLNGDMESPYFATSHFTPDLQVSISGLTDNDLQFLNSKLIEFADYKYAWIIESGLYHLLVLTKDHGKYYFHRIYTDGSRGKYEYNVEVLVDGGLKFMAPDEEDGSYEIVEKNGAIKFIGEAGNVYYERAAIIN